LATPKAAAAMLVSMVGASLASIIVSRALQSPAKSSSLVAHYLDLCPGLGMNNLAQNFLATEKIILLRHPRDKYFCPDPCSGVASII
jgi:hypothetical protein